LIADANASVKALCNDIGHSVIDVYLDPDSWVILQKRL